MKPDLKTRIVLAIQLLLTLVILTGVPALPALGLESNALKAVALLGVWAVTFGRISRDELILVVFACALFTVMDILTVQAGQFFFDHPDWMGLPYYEPLMWGFYLLHTKRMIGGTPDHQPDRVTWILVVLFALPFVLIKNPQALTVATGLVVAAAIWRYHEARDLAYAGYLLALGAIVEGTGIVFGQWHYPGEPLLGLPFWFATMWGGIGLFLWRLVLPLIHQRRNGHAGNAAARQSPASS